MLNHPTHDTLTRLRLHGMAKALAEQASQPESASLTFEERLGLLVDRELTERHNRQTTSRLRRARLKQPAVAEDIDYRHPRGLDKPLFRRLPRLFDELTVSRGDGRYAKLMASLAKVDVLILDDWGLALLDDERRRDLLELLDERYQSRSTIITSQLPVATWHDSLGDPTLADAILRGGPV
jgi:DNA replication protein DnaC